MEDLNQDLYPIPINDLKIVRQGTAFSAKPLNVGDAISYGQFNISNIENGIVFDNVTLFNDVLYNLSKYHFLLKKLKINLKIFVCLII